MAHIFRTIDKATGKPHKVWRFRYIDSNGKRVAGTGWTDKRKTLEHARNLEGEHRAIRKGEKAAPPSWLKQRNIPIAEAVNDYLDWGRVSGGKGGRPWDNQNARLKELYLEWWTKELGLATLADIDLARVEKVYRTMLVTLAPKSAALKVEALRCLCVWSVKRGRLPSNPLAGMGTLNTKPVTPHRTLTDEETAALLRVAPAHRLIWYETALETGYRVNELRYLLVRDFDPFGPSLPLGADYTKNRKDARQPITRELANKLAKLAAGRAPDAKLLSIPNRNACDYIGDDYEKANVKDVTDEGKATWHSLRKVYINNVVRSGADLKTIMALARHSSATMSMDTYAQAKPALLRAAIETAAATHKSAMAACSSHTGAKRVIDGTGFVCASASVERVSVVSKVMRATGLEPARPCGHQPLKLARLPISPRAHLEEQLNLP